jgi:hypothetical protein
MVTTAPEMVLTAPSSTVEEGSRTALGAAARDLARSYFRYVSAVWRGDQRAAMFAAWLDQFWTDGLPPAPGTMPNAFSPHGAGGHGICWFETADEVLGYVPGGAVGYRVPIAVLDRMPPLPAAGATGP